MHHVAVALVAFDVPPSLVSGRSSEPRVMTPTVAVPSQGRLRAGTERLLSHIGLGAQPEASSAPFRNRNGPLPRDAASGLRRLARRRTHCGWFHIDRRCARVRAFVMPPRSRSASHRRSLSWRAAPTATSMRPLTSMARPSPPIFRRRPPSGSGGEESLRRSCRWTVRLKASVRVVLLTGSSTFANGPQSAAQRTQKCRSHSAMRAVLVWSDEHAGQLAWLARRVQAVVDANRAQHLTFHLPAYRVGELAEPIEGLEAPTQSRFMAEATESPLTSSSKRRRWERLRTSVLLASTHCRSTPSARGLRGHPVAPRSLGSPAIVP